MSMDSLLLHESVHGYHHYSPASFNISHSKHVIKISYLLSQLEAERRNVDK